MRTVYIWHLHQSRVQLWHHARLKCHWIDAAWRARTAKKRPPVGLVSPWTSTHCRAKNSPGWAGWESQQQRRKWDLGVRSRQRPQLRLYEPDAVSGATFPSSIPAATLFLWINTWSARVASETSCSLFRSLISASAPQLARRRPSLLSRGALGHPVIVAFRSGADLVG